MYYKMSKFLQDNTAKAIAIPPVFSENSRAKKCYIERTIVNYYHELSMEDLTSLRLHLSFDLESYLTQREMALMLKYKNKFMYVNRYKT